MEVKVNPDLLQYTPYKKSDEEVMKIVFCFKRQIVTDKHFTRMRISINDTK
jgi:hypothetical protein